MPRILIVDDEPDLVRLLEYNLKQAGFETETATTGEGALATARARRPAAIVLDLMLPDLSGTEVCRQLRRDPALKATPIIMLTAKTEEVDRVVGFELGADDYLTKPFSVRELVLRIKAILRRGTPATDALPASSTLGPLEIDSVAHRAYVGGHEVLLTALEFKLLATLMNRVGRVQSREQLLSDVWGITAEIETRTVDTHVKRLREKLGEARDFIETVRGIGYRMKSAQGD